MYRPNLKPKFKDVISDGEYIVWATAPNFNAYIFSSILFFVIAMIYGFFSAFEPFFDEISRMDFSVMTNAVRSSNFNWKFIIGEISNTKFDWAVIIQLLPILFCVCNLLYKIKSHPQICYAKTNKRLIFRGGIWGKTYTSIKLDKIIESKVTISFFDVVFRTGSISFNTGQKDSEGSSINGEKMVSIPNPHAAYKEVNQVPH